MVDDCGRFCAQPESMGNPELLLSLCYLESQQKAVVVVEKATGFESNENGKALDTYVKVSAHSPSGVELGKNKSETVKTNCEPAFNLTSVFDITRSDLEGSSVLIQVFTYSGLLRRKQLVGCVCVGGENASSADAQQHWREMIQGMGITVDKWHNLLRSPLPVKS